jgi:hypothetical protein
MTYLIPLSLTISCKLSFLTTRLNVTPPPDFETELS